jgi:coenzyme F420-0:L-glutamate ligase / coenzyme F420-1:gamma-L-glutamate ligase
MDPHNFLRTRRSVRRFKQDPVPDYIIQKILETAAYAPSAHNRQPWRFLVITSISTKNILANVMAADFRRDLEHDQLSEDEIQTRLEKSHLQITTSPVIIILCMDMSDMDSYPDARRAEAEKIMAIQSTANAGMQMLLAAHAEGLGCVWTCAPLFTPNTIKNTLHLSGTWEPQGMFYLGYPAEIPQVRKRKPISEISIFI